jgi:hypothetical protein
MYGCDFFCILFYVAVVGDDGERDGGRFQPTTTTSTEASYVYDFDVDEDMMKRLS